jgi:streptogramin lyase
MSKAYWKDFYCSNAVSNPTCKGRYCELWSWNSRRKLNSKNEITWRNTKKNGVYEATWREPTTTCEGAAVAGIGCNVDTPEYVWNVNIPGIDFYWNDLVNVKPSPPGDCNYTSVFSRDNVITVTTSTSITILSSDYSATRITKNDSFDTRAFRDIAGMSVDSDDKIFILDRGYNRVGCFTYSKPTWDLFTNWGGLGGRRAQTRFNAPNDILVDHDDDVWVTDTGNACIKKYSNTGAWQNTIIDDERTGYSNPPLSLAIDVDGNIHVLTANGVYVYTDGGSYLFNYTFNNYSSLTPKRIVSNFRKEMMYVVFDDTVLKYFKNGVFAGYAISNVPGLSGITTVFHDEYRNLLVTFGDKIYKDIDIMKLKANKGELPDLYWSKQDMLINSEEYVQSWVYNKSFQKLWDNIEIMRHTVFFGDGKCKEYTPPTHSKEKILIGQNEIVTSTVVNRVIGYLWDNYSSLLKYFDPNCKN